MNLISKILVTITVLLSINTSNAQIKNAITENVKIYGNCEMCKNRIDKAGSIKKIAKVNWDENTKMAVVTYDSKKTNQDEILKRIALVGHDSDTFLAPNSTYAKLPGCCQYERVALVRSGGTTTADIKTEMVKETTKINLSNNSMTNNNQTVNPLTPIFDNYFLLKDALVKTDGKMASEKATIMLFSINAVKMETLEMEVHTVWMKVLKDLTANAKSISETQDIEKQRSVFDSLSKEVYELIKVAKPTEAVYYQYCPMKKTNWLSKENTIKNPYFGSMMLSCGSVVETIK